MGPCVNEQQLNTVMKYVQIGKDETAKLATGGHRLDKRRVEERLVPRADRVYGLLAEDAHRPGRNFRAGGVGDSVRRLSTRP